MGKRLEHVYIAAWRWFIELTQDERDLGRRSAGRSICRLRLACATLRLRTRVPALRLEPERLPEHKCMHTLMAQLLLRSVAFDRRSRFGFLLLQSPLSAMSLVKAVQCNEHATRESPHFKLATMPYTQSVAGGLGSALRLAQNRKRKIEEKDQAVVARKAAVRVKVDLGNQCREIGVQPALR